MKLPEGDEGMRTILADVPGRPPSWEGAAGHPRRRTVPRPVVVWSEPATGDVGPGA
ncbi:MAG: hypothetical protein AVDCRST_MAG05-4927 [uncultured Rubrobacteraceae bacterium]|uniref:Uncharacterized protein n=1 Tax=uncultured Rubrobacteraceae bacterium TaxID=349277 RepID=A0A6J4U0A5_9ACTN|nr:MAG: hypothetical protein AVDCRST_MAG05-4927 [uncultured Rubrobacteraceae bacterium]